MGKGRRDHLAPPLQVLPQNLCGPQALPIPTWVGLITTVFPAARQAAVFQESIIRG